MPDHRTAAWHWWEHYGAGITDPADPRLVPVPSVAGRGCLLHWAAAAVFRALAAQWHDDHPELPPLLVQSGWRAHRWASMEQWEAVCVSKYGSVAEGRKWLGYRSAHETGLALDLGSPPPMRADRRLVHRQRGSVVYRWLAEHMPPHGLRWYVPEPWHIELVLPAVAWRFMGPEAP